MNKFEQYTHIFHSWLTANYAILFGTLLLTMTVIGLIGALPIFTKQGEDDSTKIVLVFLRKMLLIFSVSLYVLLVYELSYRNNKITLPEGTFILTLLLAWVLGKISRIYFSRYIHPQLSNLFSRFRVGQTADESSDIRVEMGKVKSIEFNPIEYYRPGMIFRGLNKSETPIYDSDYDWRMNNEAAIGPSQQGKGVNIGVQIDQAIRYGHCVVFVDPKPDKFARAIMEKACKETGRKLIQIDLNGEWKTDRYNLLGSGSEAEVRSRLIRIAELEGKGSDADFYKRKERRYLDAILGNVGVRSLEKIIKECIKANSSKESPLTTTETALSEIANLISLCDQGGVKLRKAIEENAVIYIRSSTTDDRVRRITKALIDDLVQSIIATDKETGGTREHHVFVVIDEVRFLVTNLLANALATIKGFNAHMLIAYQSRLDIRNIDDQTLDKDSVETSINTNCTYKLCYVAADDDTAQFISRSTGWVSKKVADRERLETNQYGGEQLTGERHLTEKEENFVTPNTLLSLEPRCAIYLRTAKLAELIKTCWVEIKLEDYMPTKYREGEVRPSSVLSKVTGIGATVETLIDKESTKSSNNNKPKDITQELRDMKIEKE